MNYKNGRDVLPPSLLQELQKYVNGELVYIPKLDEQRARWGEVSGTRKLLAERNKEICRLHSDGSTIAELELIYHLSSESIRKIIIKSRRQPVVGGGVHVDSKYAPGTYSRSTAR
ncbi:CD3324 family protein [Cohnella nanjingensis]|uniref:CD3324 family protein n=1 Tax=Cohnella nanjingensis TaxID=1387779 RepID=UPI001FEB28EC|nr:CD3324 family protein [Cohnella nanjingensis]